MLELLSEDFFLCGRTYPRPWHLTATRFYVVVAKVQIYTQKIVKNCKEHLSKDHKLDRLTTAAHPKQQTAFMARLELADVVTSPPCASKKLAEAFIAKDYLESIGVDISPFATTKGAPLQKTPMQVLHDFVQSRKGNLDIKHDNDRTSMFFTFFLFPFPFSLFSFPILFSVFEGTVTIGEDIYKATYPYGVDHSYVKHKLSIALLKQAAFKYDFAWDGYLQV